jgi:2-polyprenyl-3-methyl-5-hydroxy-6-metoxy-1,4-benzoquinol methylase
MGGGSGAFLPSLRGLFDDVTVMDLDLGDARRIARYYALDGVRFEECDIATFDQPETFDVVVATDVLEHFLDASVPHQFLDRHLRPGGLLLLTLPTENRLYEMGRLVLGKTKPADHYHAAASLVRHYVENGYELMEKQMVPRFLGLSVPLFFVGLFRKWAA